MAYDLDLAADVRALLADEQGITEKAMFGGLAFLVHGNMAVGVSGQGGLMLRVPPDDTASLLELEHAKPMIMREREMRGWIRVDPEGCATDDQLASWVRIGLAHAGSLPPK
jgi:TfoX/Sxy family transcriptional regulator of competence genes